MTYAYVQVQARDAATGVPMSGVEIEAVSRRELNEVVLVSGVTGPGGLHTLSLDPGLWQEPVSIRVAGDAASAIPLTHRGFDGDETTVLGVRAADQLDVGHANLLAEHLVATRRVSVDDLATDLADPAPDSVVRLLPVGDRALLLKQLARRAGAHTGSADIRLIDPVALREGKLKVIPISKLPSYDGTANEVDPGRFTKPGLGWDRFGWALPDDQSYRDYLRSVFVLFAHQQQLGYAADPTKFPAIVERQLTTRFFQDFRTSDRTEVSLNRLLIPIVTRILTAPGSGFGFGVPAASLPKQGTSTDRRHLDALLALSKITVQEFANRYRLPLTALDNELSTPVKLNVRALSRILSDTAQGPIEPSENVIDPQLPGAQGKPILWHEVIGSAPFFLRFEEWLARQQPFYGENLFALRTQVEGVARGPWLDAARKRFLDYHAGMPLTQTMEAYEGHFATIDEVHRSAAFLLKYGEADAKLTELVAAIDKGQFATASRLAGQAEQLLSDAAPKTDRGENWEPEFSADFSPWPLSFKRRRTAKVTTISELTGTSATRPDGLEQFYKLDRPTDLWSSVGNFRSARDEATRLRTYQQRFVLPLLRAMISTGLGDLPGAVDMLAHVTGMFVGIATLGTPAGMIAHTSKLATRVVAGRFYDSDQLGDRPYTARLMYDDDRFLDGPFSLTPQARDGYEILAPSPPILHPVEERYARLVQGDALLAWGEALYRTDDDADLERARELYKAVLFLHGEDPGTSAYLPRLPILRPWFGLVENPRRRNQLDRARLALTQLEAGLNFYGYGDEAVPTLRYETLAGAAQRWVVGAKSAQTDYLTYLGRVEQLDLDMLVAKAQERKARATVAISAEVVEIAKAGVVVAQKLVNDMQQAIAAKQSEIEDANSIFSQFKDYLSGMKSSVSSMVDIGKSVSEGWTSLSTSGVGDALGLGESGAGAGAGAGAGGSAGLGSATAGLGAVGGFGAFAVLSTTTFLGMADAANKRQGELTTLINVALPAAQAAVVVQQRSATIAQLQGQIAATDLAFAQDLVNYQNERFLNRDFWDALAGVARRSLHRYLDLAGQAAWFAERALAYRLATPTRVVKLGYFDLRMRDLGGADRLALDLAELEAVRLGAARVTVPLTRTCSLARDLPLAFGQLKQNGTCSFSLTDDDLVAAYPGTFAHRIRSVDVVVDVPGTTVVAAGILTNGGFSLLRRDPGGTRVPLLRFADALPVSELRVGSDMGRQILYDERLLPFEGTAFTTTWTLQLPKAANPAGLQRVTDVRIAFEVQAGYDPLAAGVPALRAAASRSTFVSALAVDARGLTTLRKATTPAQVRFALDNLALPPGSVITNLAVLVPGVDDGSYKATMSIGSGPALPFVIKDGLAASNLGVLSDAVPTHAEPLNAAIAGSPARPVTVKIQRGNDGGKLAKARDVLLWIEYLVA